MVEQGNVALLLFFVLMIPHCLRISQDKFLELKRTWTIRQNQCVLAQNAAMKLEQNHIQNAAVPTIMGPGEGGEREGAPKCPKYGLIKGLRAYLGSLPSSLPPQPPWTQSRLLPGTRLSPPRSPQSCSGPPRQCLDMARSSYGCPFSG